MIELINLYDSYSVQINGQTNVLPISKFKPMLAKPADLNTLKLPVFIQPKIDGNRAIFINNNLYSRNLNILSDRPGLQYIMQDLIKLNSLIKGRFQFDGELYSKNLKFEEING